MSKRLKTFLIVTASIIVAVICMFVFIFTLFPPKVSKTTMEGELVKNKEVITSVINYLIEVPYETIVIRDTEKGLDLFVYNGEGGDSTHLTVDDEDTANNISFLFKKCHYSVITKSGDAISFLRWTQFRDVGTGIIYSIDGHTPNESNLDFLTKLEPLSEENWYYYEEDFNEWKRRSTQNTQITQ